MKQVFDQLLKFLREGDWCNLPIRRALIWTWSVDQVSKLLASPWHDWPLWKQLLLVLILIGVILGVEQLESSCRQVRRYCARLRVCLVCLSKRCRT